MNESMTRSDSRSTLLAVEDTEFLLRDEMRAIRFALEYGKAELALRDWGIRSTIIVFGGARVPSPEQAAAAAEAARTDVERELAEKLRRRSEFYRIAREFGRIASQRGGAFAPKNRWRDNVIATGGGPGLMEAANRGASDVGAPNIGFNITLPHEQMPNPYITPELSFRFHYFAMRKMHLAMRANALAIFPGGFGTMDELFAMAHVKVQIYDGAAALFSRTASAVSATGTFLPSARLHRECNHKAFSEPILETPDGPPPPRCQEGHRSI